jgi:hypothetical protein
MPDAKRASFIESFVTSGSNGMQARPEAKGFQERQRLQPISEHESPSVRAIVQSFVMRH